MQNVVSISSLLITTEIIVADSRAALLRVVNALTVKGNNPDQEAGINIVRRALQASARQIASNSGEEAAIIVGKVLENNADTFGYNTATGEFSDLIASKNY